LNNKSQANLLAARGVALNLRRPALLVLAERAPPELLPLDEGELDARQDDGLLTRVDAEVLAHPAHRAEELEQTRLHCSEGLLDLLGHVHVGLEREKAAD